ncbi:SMP-30/gluconolactonase/LRE family protein [Roseateles sp.]|uniref:SMP-30/gluconolactonase/LRE family protein n=1 Tax=Roseateles sp. TaxID=1971397 RepID=UPI003BA920D7
MPPELHLALPQTATLGEGLQWHAATGRWWWTDIEASTVYAWTPGTPDTLRLRLPERVGSFVHCRSGALLLGMAKRLVRLRLADPQACGDVAVLPDLEVILPVEALLPTTRINDGRCDRAGHYVFGTLDEARPRQAIGRFYQYSATHGLRPLALGGVAIANSICFSPDGRLMYHCDTLTRRIMVCDYDAETAGVSAPRVFAQKDVPDCWPDGATIDAQGCLWNAEWGHASVARYAPDGVLLSRHAVAAPHVTCPALGGPGGDQLFVTTAREEMSHAQIAARPLSGSLFGMTVDAGLHLPEVLFND